jgi:hypothetical protein
MITPLSHYGIIEKIGLSRQQGLRWKSAAVHTSSLHRTRDGRVRWNLLAMARKYNLTELELPLRSIYYRLGYRSVTDWGKIDMSSMKELDFGEGFILSGPYRCPASHKRALFRVSHRGSFSAGCRPSSHSRFYPFDCNGP